MKNWKLFTLACGIGLLIWGRYYYQAPDWDIGISLVMAGFAYLFAGWSMDVIMRRDWRKVPAMLLATWWTVDGCYWIYWSIVDPSALVMRPANFWASLSLFWMCGLVWSDSTGKPVAQALANAFVSLRDLRK